MKKRSANTQICQSLNEFVSNKINQKEFYLLAKELTYIVDSRIYEYESNTKGLLNQSYYNRVVNSWLRSAMFKQGTNKSFGMPFPEHSPLARVIYIGEF